MRARRGLKVERQKVVAFEYDGMRFEEGWRLDLLVENRIIVELKSVEKMTAVHPKQVLTYLRLMNLPVGLLINFGAATFKEGVQRIVNNYRPSSASRPLRVNRGFACSAEPRRTRRRIGNYEWKNCLLGCQSTLVH